MINKLKKIGKLEDATAEDKAAFCAFFVKGKYWKWQNDAWVEIPLSEILKG